MSRDPRRAYRVVDAFEAELADYTGAAYAVAVNSCTNALFLALTWEQMGGGAGPIAMPRRTYVGVAQAVLNAGYDIEWVDDGKWQEIDGYYCLRYTQVIDSARMLRAGLWDELWGMTCLSFHAAKQLPLGRGGAILTDNKDAADWFRAARMDGRPPGKPIEETIFPGYHCPMPPDVAARGLDILSRWNDAGYSPPPLPYTDYPDLSLLELPNRKSTIEKADDEILLWWETFHDEHCIETWPHPGCDVVQPTYFSSKPRGEIA